MEKLAKLLIVGAYLFYETIPPNCTLAVDCPFAMYKEVVNVVE